MHVLQGQTLNSSILVPFPVESCLSGVGETHQYFLYRTVFDAPFAATGNTITNIHFGAVDWNTTVYLNGAVAGTHVGGYDGFSFDITTALQATGNELFVYVFDPSDAGAQPNGKQRISAITNPGGDTYTPSSGIWQTVWLESVPSYYITSLVILADSATLTLTANANSGSGGIVTATVYNNGAVVQTLSGASGSVLSSVIPNPRLWQPSNPFLFNLTITACSQASTGVCDTVHSYFGMRSVTLGTYERPGTPPTGPQTGIDRGGMDLPGYPVALPQADPNLCWDMCNQTAECQAWAYGMPDCGGDPAQAQCWLKSGSPSPSSQPCRVSGAQGTAAGLARRPFINGNFTFLAGWLDQSWWPDGQYTAPTDAALAFDVQAIALFGLNTVRLHQKVNPERWYWYADVLGVVVLQDMIQQYGGASAATVPLFMADLKAMIDGRYNHPSIIQVRNR